MSRVIQNLSIKLDEDLQEKLRLMEPQMDHFRILRKSIDARRRHELREVYTVEVFQKGESIPAREIRLDSTAYNGPKPVVVGSGPAGLFAALRLAERGIPVRLIERGSNAQKRILGINRFWRYGELDPNNNVCFGEGGAGLYSDGKLITRIKSDHIPYVMRRLVEFGAPEEIEYLSNPHVGSDRIRRVIPKLRARLIELGCEIYFDTRMTELVVQGKQVVGVKTHTGETFHTDHVILATGHSANDIFDHLHELGVALEGKSFALGLRVEHPQEMVNKIQYRGHADHPKLGAANYKLTYHQDDTGIGVYSFCMCPGGYVLSSGTEAGGVVANGMSNYHRNSPFANAAIVVTIDHPKLFGNDLFGGMKFRTGLEQSAYQAVQKAGGTRQIPAQRLVDFMAGRSGPTLPTSSPSGVTAVRLDQIVPSWLREELNKGFESFEQSMKGFISDKAQLHGVESRTSCPLRIPRDAETFESISHAGLFPAGEGAGYAGGITSAAVDGIKIAERIYQTMRSRPSML